MATPPLTEQVKSYTFQMALGTTQQQMNGVVTDVDGAPIDIDTGWSCKVFVGNNPGPVELVPSTDFDLGTFGSDGSWEIGLNPTGLAKLPNGTRSLCVLFSNDSFTTTSVGQRGNITVARYLS